MHTTRRAPRYDFRTEPLAGLRLTYLRDARVADRPVAAGAVDPPSPHRLEEDGLDRPVQNDCNYAYQAEGPTGDTDY